MSKYFKISCTNCNKTLKVSEDLAGKNRVCPYCHTAIRIPKPTPTAPADNAFPNVDVSGTTLTTPTPSPSRRRKRAWYSAGSGESASSDVSLSISCMMGAVMCVVWLAMMFPLRQYQFGQLFWDRGWVPFATTFLMFWSVGILILKWLNLKQQRESMLLDLLPTEVSKEITLKSLDPFVEHINQLPTSAGESFLSNRVLRGIEHFRVRKSAAEVVTMMESQSAIDANNVAGSYTLLKRSSGHCRSSASLEL